MRRILFVDDEPNILEGLQRMMRSMRNEWEMEFANNGPQALELLDLSTFDVVVSDMRMPVMDGAKFLAEVRNRHPHTVRIVLSGQSDQEMIMKSVGPAHQYLSKPCDAESLKSTIGRACALHDLLANDALKLLISQMESLPSLPLLYVELMEELESPNGSMKRIGEIASQDPGMTAKLLQVVNSAFFGVKRHVSNPAEAANLLGVDTLRALVLSVHIFSQFNQAQTAGFSLKTLWSHSMAVGKLSRLIARAEHQKPPLCDEAFTAGLLHKSGQLVLASRLPEKYAETLALVQEGQVSLIDAERKICGAGHPEVGAYLLGLWGLPTTIIEAVAFQRNPSVCLQQDFSPLTAVHIAAQLQSAAGAEVGAEVVSELDLDYLDRLGLKGKLTAWQEIQSEMSTEGA